MGRALPLAPLCRRTDGGDSAGLRKDPRSPRATWRGCGALPCAPRTACLRRSHRAPTGRGGARRGREGWAGPGHLVSAPPRQCGPAGSQLVGRSLHPGCSPRKSGDSEEALPPPPIPALAGSSLASRLAGLTLCWLLGGGSGSPSSPLLPTLGDPEGRVSIASAAPCL